jgi:hypothetical protein
MVLLALALLERGARARLREESRRRWITRRATEPLAISRPWNMTMSAKACTVFRVCEWSSRPRSIQSSRWHELEGLSVGGESSTITRRSECDSSKL